jgi:chemotaxis protein methyltransferase CheR
MKGKSKETGVSDRVNIEVLSNKLPLSDLEFDLVKSWIYEAAGILLTPAKKALVQGRLSRRVATLNHKSVAEYVHFLTTSKNDPNLIVERQHAINALTTNETYFFREIAHYELLQQLVLRKWDKYHKPRIWSAASSTGEEAYSIAMTLASVGAVDYEVVGTDINSMVIEQATSGIYPIQRAEKIPLDKLKAFCLKGVGAMDGYFQIAPEIKSKVKFQRGNITQAQRSNGLFDVIFLRNVLIYFDKNSKQLVLDNVINQLKPDGYLLIGHAESLNGLEHSLTNLKPSVFKATAS